MLNMTKALLLQSWVWLAAVAALQSGQAAAQVEATIGPTRSVQVPRDKGQVQSPVVSAVAVSPNGRLVAAAGDDHLVRVWDVTTNLEGNRPLVLRGHADWVRSVSFSPDGTTLVSGGEDRNIIVWEMPSGRRLRVLPAQSQAVYSLCHSPDGKRLAVIGFASKLRLLDSDGILINELECPCTDMRAVAFSPDGRLAAAAGRNGELSVWNASTGEPAFPKVKAHRRRIRAVAFSPAGDMIATGGEGLNIRLWDAPHGPGVVFDLQSSRQDPVVGVLRSRLVGRRGNQQHHSRLESAKPAGRDEPGRPPRLGDLSGLRCGDVDVGFGEF